MDKTIGIRWHLLAWVNCLVLGCSMVVVGQQNTKPPTEKNKTDQIGKESNQSLRLKRDSKNKPRLSLKPKLKLRRATSKNSDKPGAPENSIVRDDTSARAIELINDLPRGTKRHLDEFVFPALAAGNLQQMYVAATPIIQKSSLQHLNAIEEYAKAKGMGSFRSAFVDAKIQRIEQGYEAAALIQNVAVTLYSVKGMHQRIQAFMDALNQHSVMHDPLVVPIAWSDSRELFWDINVFKHELDNLSRLADYSSAMMLKLKKTILKSSDANNISILDAAGQLPQALKRLKRDLIEREAELRLVRLKRALATLAKSQLFETQFVAATTIDLDSEVLDPILSRPPVGGFARQHLRQADRLKELGGRVKLAMSENESLFAKVRLLRNGLHYWLKGRYGMGPMANGLLKTPEAMNSQTAMNSLYMPRKRPKPISSFHSPEESSDGYDRRHFYTWDIERRSPLSYRNASGSEQKYKKAKFYW